VGNIDQTSQWTEPLAGAACGCQYNGAAPYLIVTLALLMLIGCSKASRRKKCLFGVAQLFDDYLVPFSSGWRFARRECISRVREEKSSEFGGMGVYCQVIVEPGRGCSESAPSCEGSPSISNCQ
jgi:hypothetical protein